VGPDSPWNARPALLSVDGADVGVEFIGRLQGGQWSVAWQACLAHADAMTVQSQRRHVDPANLTQILLFLPGERVPPGAVDQQEE
jgi:hypothetical protein